MQRITISELEYKHRQFWAISGMFSAEQLQRMRCLPNTYFSRSMQCWLICRNQLTESEIAAILDAPVSAVAEHDIDTVAQELLRKYRSPWSTIAPITKDMYSQMKVPKSLKYRCILRLLYLHHLSIHQVCSIELRRLNWCDTALEIVFANYTGLPLVLDRHTSELMSQYIAQSQPEIYLFESQPCVQYIEEKMYRVLLSYLP